MSFTKKRLILIMGVVLSCLYLFLRFYNLKDSMFFFNDMGRDMLVLQDWSESGKPPLLGPQTSALPINQSAIYFYLLMPGFLLTNGAPMTLFYTNAFIYVVPFLIGLWMLRDHSKVQISLLFFFLLVCFSPQYLAQSRIIVWNPSFVTPPLLTALLTFVFLTKKFSNKLMFLFVSSLAFAVSLSYSIAPTFIAIYLYVLFFWHRNRVKIILTQIVALFVINLPTLAFEIKHGFLLIHSLFSRGLMTQRSQETSLISKYNNLFGLGIGTEGLYLLFLTVLIGLLIFQFQKSKNNNLLKIVTLLLISTVVLTFIFPFEIHSHYIFGFTTLVFLAIALLPSRPRLIILFALLITYIPQLLSNERLFTKNKRTYSEMNSCFSILCSEIKEPIFVSAQSNFHPFHNALEHRFMMKKNGCQVRYIENEPDAANLMAVVLDDSSFKLGETSYNELTLFGKAIELKRYQCQSNFEVVVLKKEP